MNLPCLNKVTTLLLYSTLTNEIKDFKAGQHLRFLFELVYESFPHADWFISPLKVAGCSICISFTARQVF